MWYSRHKIACLLFLVLGAGWLFITACTSVPQEGIPSAVPHDENPSATIMGNIFDGKTGESLKNTDVKIAIRQVSGGRWNEVFTATQKANVKGDYLFKISSMDTLTANSYLEYQLEREGYIASLYMYSVTDKTPSVTLNFGLIKADDSIILSGQVMNVTDRLPMPDVKINLNLQTIDRNERKNLSIVGALTQPKPKTEIFTYVTDKEGKYQTKLPAVYMPFANMRAYYFSIKPELSGFDLATTETRINNQQIDGKPGESLNFTGSQSVFYLVDPQQEGALKGTLLDNGGDPMANIPIIVKLGQRKG